MHVHVCPFSFLPRAIVKFTPTHRHPPFPSPTLLSSQKMKGTHLSRNQRGYFFLSFFFSMLKHTACSTLYDSDVKPPPPSSPEKKTHIRRHTLGETWELAVCRTRLAPVASGFRVCSPDRPAGSAFRIISADPPSRFLKAAIKAFHVSVPNLRTEHWNYWTFINGSFLKEGGIQGRGRRGSAQGRADRFHIHTAWFGLLWNLSLDDVSRSSARRILERRQDREDQTVANKSLLATAALRTIMAAVNAVSRWM